MSFLALNRADIDFFGITYNVPIMYPSVSLCFALGLCFKGSDPLYIPKYQERVSHSGSFRPPSDGAFGYFYSVRYFVDMSRETIAK